MTIKIVELNEEKNIQSHHYMLCYIFMCSRKLKFVKLLKKTLVCNE